MRARLVGGWLAGLWLAGCGDPAGPGGGASDSADGADGADSADSAACETDAEFFAGRGAAVLSDCAGCHVAGGLAGGTRYVLEPFADGAAAERNRQAIAAFVTGTADGAALMLDKPTGRVSHGGGARVEAYSEAYVVLAEAVGRARAPGGCGFPGDPPPVCADGEVRPGSAPLRRLTPDQYVESVRAVFGVEVEAALFPATTQPPAAGGFRTFASLNTVSEAGVEQIMVAAEAVSAGLALPGATGCAAEDRACARAWLLDRAAAAFRRPLLPGEEGLATAFLDAGLDVDTAIRMQVELLLQSPQFLYLDAAPAEAGDPARVDGWALASRLSYYLTGGPPDAELRAAAGAGALSTRAEVLAQAERLARSPAAVGSVAAFHRDWLHLWRLEGAQRDPERYPWFSEALAGEMLQEVDLFTTEIVWSGDPTLDRLLLGTEGWVSPGLAGIYGLEAPAGWSLVALPDRPGVLTRAAFLTAHGYYADSAPVRRGAWVLQAMRCEDLTPPADVDMTLPDPSGDLPTIRERLAAHTADPACAACHVRIDPIGLAFEHYGAAGERREVWDDGYPVDATGSLTDPAGSFDGAAELLELLRGDPRVPACYARRVFEYAVGRSAEEEDACALQQLTARFVASGGDLRRLWADVAITDAFLYRHALEAP